MRTLIMILAGLVGLLIIAGVALLWLLKDPNQHKDKIEALIEENAGIKINIEGDLSWRLWPPIVLQAADLNFEDEETKYDLARLSVHANAKALLQSEPDLQIQSLELNGLTMSDKRFDSVTEVVSLTLTDFSLNKASPLHLEAITGANTAEPTPFEMDALITYRQDDDAVDVNDIQFETAGIVGTCDAVVTQLSREPTSNHSETSEDLLPLDTFRSKDWDATCNIPSMDAGGLVLANVGVTAKNTGGRSNINVNVPEFFDGTAKVDVDINASRHSPRWKVNPDVSGADTQAVMAWMEQNLKWAAPLLFNGEFTMIGNTTDDLISSVSGNAKFDGGTGKIDISAIKESASTLASLASVAGANVLPELQEAIARVAAWPEELDYSELAGDWKINGSQQDFDFALDNLAITATGTADALTDKLDMRAELTFLDSAALNSFDIPSALRDIPIPVRCVGTMSEPDCGLDRSATQTIIAGVLRGEASSKIQDAIADKVPDEYKEAAGGLLKGLFGGKKKDN